MTLRMGWLCLPLIGVLLIATGCKKEESAPTPAATPTPAAEPATDPGE